MRLRYISRSHPGSCDVEEQEGQVVPVNSGGHPPRTVRPFLKSNQSKFGPLDSGGKFQFGSSSHVRKAPTSKTPFKLVNSGDPTMLWCPACRTHHAFAVEKKASTSERRLPTPIMQVPMGTPHSERLFFEPGVDKRR